MEPDALAKSIATATVSRRRLVPLWEIHKLAIESGFLLAVESAAESHAKPEVQAAARVALRYMNNPRFDNLDIELPTTVAMLDVLVAGGVLTADNAGRHQRLGRRDGAPATCRSACGPILPGHILKARAL